ncbi:MAG: leucine-rich repeat domain-containing protein [Bacteroidales bacterium]|nr:leucine-rich repeat domain-containing protein [Bacteroidales bacterium]
MKKLILSLLTVLLPMVAFAEYVQIDGIYYDLVTKAKEAIVTKNPNKYSGTVVIPASVSYNGVEYNVTSIGEYAFSNSDLTSVTIPNSVTSLGRAAFYYSLGLTSVVLGDGLQSISYEAFCGCSSLSSVNLPESVTSLDYQAFAGCSSLPSINLPNSLTQIGYRALGGCSSLTSITIPDSLRSIGYRAFDSCNGLTKVNISDMATWFGISFDWGSDDDRSGLYHPNFTCNPLFYAHHLYLNGVEVTEIEIPDNVTTINGATFAHWKGLTSVTFPNINELKVGKYAFEECTGLTSVNISDMAKWCSFRFGNTSSNPLNYAQRLYLNGNEIKDLIVPDGVTDLLKYSFTGFSGLTSVTIPNSVNSIGTHAFCECSGLLSASIPGSVRSIDEYAFYGCSDLTTVTLSDGLQTIGKLAFMNCSSLTSIDIPNSVISIEGSAFYDCSSLTSLTLPNNLYTIEALSFSSCGMTTVTIPDGVANIGASAFSNCKNLGIVIIGRGVRKIENMAFSSCPEITDVYCYAERVPEATYWAFQDSYIDYATLHVPANSIEAYKAQSPWNTFKYIVPLDGQSIETFEYTSPSDRIAIYSVDGKLISSATSPSEATDITSHLPSGTTAIIRMGGKSVKVMVK